MIRKFKRNTDPASWAGTLPAVIPQDMIVEAIQITSDNHQEVIKLFPNYKSLPGHDFPGNWIISYRGMYSIVTDDVFQDLFILEE